MKTYLCPQAITLIDARKGTLQQVFLLILLTFFFGFTQAQELVFKNPVLEAGTEGADGAVYRFSNIRPGGNTTVDALVTISGRSSNLVSLSNIDMVTTGHGKAFQPQVAYNNGTTPDGNSNWYLEFSFSFVQAGTNTRLNVDSFRLTALDIDGNGDRINEWVSFYNQKMFMLEENSVLRVSTVSAEMITNAPVEGRMFEGPTENFTNIDTNATAVMVTNYFQGLNTFKMRVGGSSTGSNGAADRMYSFWFRSFSFTSAVQFQLPLVLLGFDATLKNKNTELTWVTGMEKELSHFMIERSTNGSDYTQVGMVVAGGNSDVKKNYSFTDPAALTAKGVVYYRLRMVDMNGRFQNSQVRLIRIGDAAQTLSIAAYPNPVVNEVRITLPNNWQNQPVSFTFYNTNGQAVKSMTTAKASQTETMGLSELNAGIYIVKVTSGTETAIQRIVKAK